MLQLVLDWFSAPAPAKESPSLAAPAPVMPAARRELLLAGWQDALARVLQ